MVTRADQSYTSKRNRTLICRVAFAFMIFHGACITAVAQDADVTKLKELSFEELMDIQVTSVSKTPQRLNEVASAIQVITHDDIMRSGATNIPEALRLSPNLQVAQVSSSTWIISSRGFNTVFANKLLVMIDGRTVYTPLFGGVLWDLQNVLLEDVDRIEIISGPGATLWGANAVNGVINIITKRVEDTQGLYVSALAGDYQKSSFAARYGGNLSEKIAYRVYAQTADRNSTSFPNGNEANDAWRTSQAGFKLGITPTSKDNINIQGDAYMGTKQTRPQKSPFDGQNLLGRWTHTKNERSDFVLQAYYDRYWRNDASTADQLATYDVDFQNRLMAGKRHHVLWGLGYRVVRDEVINRISIAGLVPADRTMPLYSGFIQDEMLVHENVKITVGTKLLNNIFSGFEIQPSVRAAWTVSPNSTLWAAVSRAIRAPSRFDTDYRLPIEPQPPTSPSVIGNLDFQSEKLHAFEFGFRTQPNRKASLSAATFYNRYNDLYSVELVPGTLTYLIQNGSEGTSWGGELSGFYQILSSWRLRGGYTFFAKDLHARPGHINDPAYLSNDAKHHVVLQSMLDLPFHFKFDIVGRYLSEIPASFATARVPAYSTFDVRVAWSFKKLELSATGQNLAEEEHPEFGTQRMPRSFYGKVAFRF